MGELLTWVERNQCQIGLGDGAGLNFVARLEGAAKYIVDECVSAFAATEPLASP